MDEKEAQSILKKNKIQAMRQFAMMMKEERFQQLIGKLVKYRSDNGSEEFNKKIEEIFTLFSSASELKDAPSSGG